MNIVDTHTHLFLDQFNEDRDEVIKRAKDQSVKQFFLPNIDKNTIPGVWKMTTDYPGTCYAMMGLHPCSVGADYKTHLDAVEEALKDQENIYAVGETGLDFHWDDGFAEAQKESFRHHLRWGKATGLPVVIHCRKSFDAIYDILKEENNDQLSGILHCFTGTVEEGNKILDLGNFYLGIGGIITFKNAGLDQVVKNLPLEGLVLETDSPYLAPHPYRGKRNESGYTRIIGEKLATTLDLPLEHIAEQTTANAETIFNVNLT